MSKTNDLRVQKTTKALMDAFTQLLIEKRFEDITVREICDRSMVRRATFYTHYTDKYDFFAAFIREIQAKLSKHIQDTYEPTSTREYFVHIFDSCCQFLSENRTLVNSVLISNSFPTLLNIFTEEIERDILQMVREEQKRGVEINFSLELFASFCAGGIVQILSYWIHNRDHITMDELHEEAIKIMQLIQPCNSEQEAKDSNLSPVHSNN